MRFNIFFRRNRPVNDEEKRLDGGIGPDHVKVRNIHNNYLQDREEQRHETFTGMGKQFLIHDSCATESMGPIYDRSNEHLGAGDITRAKNRRTSSGRPSKTIFATLPA